MHAAPGANLIALFLAVWVIYLFDRLLDVSRVTSTDFLTERHRWTRDHVILIASLGVIALGFLVAVILQLLEKPTLIAGGVPGLITLIYYLVFRFLRTAPLPWRLPYKEIVIALCFALGIFIAATAEAGGGNHLVLFGGLVLLFLANCLLIARDESALDSRNDPSAYFADAFSGPRRRLPEAVSILAMMSSLSLLGSGVFPLSSTSLLIGSGLTLLLARNEGKAGPAFIQTQTIADGILMIPLVLALLRMILVR